MKAMTLMFSAAVLAMPATAIPALAHHSYAEFDTATKVTLQGTVKEFQWTNPHSWVVLMVPDAKGKPVQWAIEMNPVSMLAAKGWKPKTVMPGDKIAITFHPMKNGAHAGSYMTLVLPDGKVMGGGAAASAAETN